MARTIAAAQALIVLLGVASLVYTASNRNLQRLYQPTVAFLNANVRPEDVVFARSEFYFGLQCRTCLRDDANLGALSGWRAQYIVLEPDYTDHLVELREKSPVIYREIEQRLNTEYQEVFQQPQLSGYAEDRGRTKTSGVFRQVPVVRQQCLVPPAIDRRESGPLLSERPGSIPRHFSDNGSTLCRMANGSMKTTSFPWR
jgi:hypothetical protein